MCRFISINGAGCLRKNCEDSEYCHIHVNHMGIFVCIRCDKKYYKRKAITKVNMCGRCAGITCATRKKQLK